MKTQEVVGHIDRLNTELKDTFVTVPIIGSRGYATSDALLCIKEVALTSYLQWKMQPDRITASSPLDYVEYHVRNGDCICYNRATKSSEIRASHWSFHGLLWQYDSNLNEFSVIQRFIVNSGRGNPVSVERIRSYINRTMLEDAKTKNKTVNPENVEKELLNILSTSL